MLGPAVGGHSSFMIVMVLVDVRSHVQEHVADVTVDQIVEDLPGLSLAPDQPRAPVRRVSVHQDNQLP